jgi:hypothetical protein
LAYIYQDPNAQMLEAAEQELAQCVEQERYLKQRIPELKEMIRGLKMLVKKAQQQDVTDSLPALCLRVLSFSQMPQTAQQVRDGLRLTGIEVQGANPLGIIYTALARLVNNELAEVMTPFPGAAKHYRVTPAGRLTLQGTFTGPAPGGF